MQIHKNLQTIFPCPDKCFIQVLMTMNIRPHILKQEKGDGNADCKEFLLIRVGFRRVESALGSASAVRTPLLQNHGILWQCDRFSLRSSSKNHRKRIRHSRSHSPILVPHNLLHKYILLIPLPDRSFFNSQFAFLFLQSLHPHWNARVRTRQKHKVRVD